MLCSGRQLVALIVETRGWSIFVTLTVLDSRTRCPISLKSSEIVRPYMAV